MSRTGQTIGDILLEKLTLRVKVTQGSIYKVSDHPKNPIVKFPEDNLPEDHSKKQRSFHKQRYVLVIQDNTLNQNRKINSVLVAPLSHRGIDTNLTVVIPTQFLGQTLPGDAVARIHQTQPILKYFLEEEVGRIPHADELWTTIRATYLSILNII